MIWVVLGIAFLLAGLLLLQVSWQRRSEKPRWAVEGGWLAILVGIGLFCVPAQVSLGITHGCLALAVLAYGVVAASVQFRPARHASSNEAALEPEARKTNWRRSAAKALLAIVLAGIAAIGVGVAFAVAMPMPATDRIMIGGVLVPLLWGGGMAWTLADSNLVRAALFLAGISIVSYAAAFLPKLLS